MDSSGSEQEQEQEFEQQDTDSDPENMEDFHKQLRDMPFEELEQVQQRVGTKVFNLALRATPAETKGKMRKFKRENKNRPQEISSKKRPPKLKKVVQVKKKVNRDPRFDDLSGEYKEELFAKSYSFLGDIKQRERQKVLRAYSKEKDESKKKKLAMLINKMDNEAHRKKQEEAKKSMKAVVKKNEKAMISEGKKPFYLKKSEQKKLELSTKYKELKDKGKLDDYLAKKKKKIASKDRKQLPWKESQ